MRRTFAIACMAATLSQGSVARAEVSQSSESGFVVTGERTITGVTGAAAWAMLVQPGVWWNSAHSWSGDAANMTLDPRAGGCFCEAIPSAEGAASVGSVEHMRVIHVKPGAMLLMRGTLGPLQSEALTGVLTIEMEERPASLDTGPAVAVRWTYVVGGYSRLALPPIAPAVDQVLAEQMGRLDLRLQADD
jgi:hypothetical protein